MHSLILVHIVGYYKRRQQEIHMGFLLWMLCMGTAFGQSSSLRVKWLYPKGWPLPADTLSIDPASVRVLYPIDSTLQAIYQPASNRIYFQAIQLPDSVLVSYRVFPFWLSKPVFHRDPETYDKVVYFGKDPNGGKNDPSDKREEFFTTKGIQKTGSLTRGISFGNAQNVFVNSALNLQLEGQLTDEISLRAVISDQNVPFQPEGNTQTLQEFDKVFVQLQSKTWQLAAGDIVFRNPLWKNNYSTPSYFLRYYKNVQGAQAETQYDFLGGKASTRAGLAVSKGKFASTVLPVSEGTQGPYRLRGATNERFIIILANSERVYLDGRLLQRGFNNDYTIDYNTSEITFTPSIIITAFSRVRVDFEYSDRNYSRSIFTLAHDQQMGKVHVFANYYNEKDNPRQLFSLDLTETDKRLLSKLDNQTQVGVVSGAKPIGEFTETQILYRKVDSVYNGLPYTVFIYTTNPKGPLYQVQFNDVGLGKGNYERVQATTNGQVYQWIPPQNGIPQGSFDTLRTVPLPTQKRMLTTGVEYQLSKTETIYGEWAFSEQNKNLFSTIPATDNQGNAFKIGYKNQGKPLSFFPTYEWIGSVDYEQDSRSFSPIDRFRDVDFDRDWTLNDSTLATDQFFNVQVGIRKRSAQSMQIDSAATVPKTDTNTLLAPPAAVPADNPAPSASFTPTALGNQVVYGFSRRVRAGVLSGYQHRVDAARQIGKLQLTAQIFWLHALRKDASSEWKRLQTVADYRGHYLNPGYAFSLDKNRLNSRVFADSIVGTAMNFEEHRFFLRNGDSLKTRFQVDYSLRQDYLPARGEFQKHTFSRTANANWQTPEGKKQMWQLTLTYRTLTNQFLSQPSTADEETLMGRLDWNSQWLKRSIRSELTLATASGRELQREFVYLPVPVGEGTHTWRDDNGDGKQDLNEFYEAINPDEKRYAKFFVPTDQYIRAFTQNLSYRLNATVPTAWRDRGKVLLFLSRLSSVSSWTVSRKTIDTDLWSRILPIGSAQEEAVLSAQESVRSTLFYNRTHPGYGLDGTYLQTATKQLLTGRADKGNNFEIRQIEEWRFNGRVNIGKSYSLRNSWTHIRRTNQSNFLTTRNYQIVGQQVSPELAFQPVANFRLAGAYSFSAKKNVYHTEMPESAQIHTLSTEVRWSKIGKRTLSATLRRVQISFQGEANTPVGYELLEALRPGTNWIWNLNWQQRLTSGLQMTIGYDGRQSEDQPIIHIGRMQVTALF